ncbi:hypothetical protein BGZ94_004149, partial [Podila epigama]
PHFMTTTSSFEPESQAGQEAIEPEAFSDLTTPTSISSSSSSSSSSSPPPPSSSSSPSSSSCQSLLKNVSSDPTIPSQAIVVDSETNNLVETEDVDPKTVHDPPPEQPQLSPNTEPALPVVLIPDSVEKVGSIVPGWKRPSSQGDGMDGPTFAQNTAQKRSVDDTRPMLTVVIEHPPPLLPGQDEPEGTTMDLEAAPQEPALKRMTTASFAMHDLDKETDAGQLEGELLGNQSTISAQEEEHEDDDDGHDSDMGIAMSMASPAKHSSKSPPISSASTSSAPRKSSMILHPGTLSPAWSLNSIPRDISATYRIQLPPLEPGLDEKLFGLVDRYGFLVEDGRKPTAEKNSLVSSSSRSSLAATETLTFLINKKSSGSDPALRQQFQELCDTSSPEEEQIDLDIPRTMYGHIMFKERFGPGQCALFHVLKAYSNYNRQVGYCQGMASIVAAMLTFFEQEKAFVLLVQLFEHYNIHSLVIPGFPALFEAFYIQEGLTKKYAPKVFNALETMGIATPSYASRWYITLYSAGVVPYRTLLRIWDIFLLEGFEWLYFMALALLKYHEAALLQNNFEQTMEMLNAKMNIQDDDHLIQTAQKFYKRARRSRIVVQLKKAYIASLKTT